MSDIASGANQSADPQLSETPGSEARRFREVLDEGQGSGQAADIVRGMVREAPLLALASAFLMGILIGRRR
jgi:hypothetical protein